MYENELDLRLKMYEASYDPYKIDIIINLLIDLLSCGICSMFIQMSV